MILSVTLDWAVWWSSALATHPGIVTLRRIVTNRLYFTSLSAWFPSAAWVYREVHGSHVKSMRTYAHLERITEQPIFYWCKLAR